MNKLGVVFVLSIVAAVAVAQSVRSPEPFRLSVDLARFRGPDDSTGLTELYYSLPQRSLVYVADTSGFVGGMDISIIVSEKDSLVFADRWLAPSRVKDTADLVGGLNLVGICQIPLKRGEFVVKILGRDKNAPARKDSVLIKLTFVPVGSDRTTLSDIELASTIRKSQHRTPFYKNTLEVIPNVDGVYGADQPCYMYAEAYNLLIGPDTGAYVERTAIYDAIGRERFVKDREKKRFGESSVLVNQIGLTELQTGTYSLVVSLLDTSKKVMTSTSRKFFVLNQKLGTDSTLLAASSSVPLVVLASMSEKDLDEEFKQAKYEATGSEETQYKLLKGEDAKRKFLSAFWRRRPPGYRDAYMARIGYANQNYTLMKTPGYRSDRGRVYIVYGPPDDVERHPSESDTRAYEIWSYHSIQGGVIFVFVQRNATGEYELVHSTDRNELQDNNWQRYLNPNYDQNQINVSSPQY
ncbi:MAG: GWxTD domain-containing protein [Bacteroidota bacterium]